MRTLTAVVFSLFALAASASETRVGEILASFSKSKNVQKTKGGVTRSVFVERHGVAIAGTDGHFAVDGIPFELRLAGEGGSGRDPRGAFTLRDIHREGAYVAATKVYENGRTAPLEGVFMELVTRAGKTSADATTTRLRGIGVVLDEPYSLGGGVSVERVFYERR
jgi:hypothetical protein